MINYNFSRARRNHETYTRVCARVRARVCVTVCVHIFLYKQLGFQSHPGIANGFCQN